MSIKRGYIILFDGICNLCNASVQFVIRRDPHHKFRFASLQSEAARNLLNEYGHTDPSNESVIFIEDGKLHRASTAILRIARRLSFPWPVFYIFMLVPERLRDLVYQWVGRNRFRWFGKRDSCMMPESHQADRFLS